jgi:uncharacterized membrane protein YjjP (DUF1212 family)
VAKINTIDCGSGTSTEPILYGTSELEKTDCLATPKPSEAPPSDGLATQHNETGQQPGVPVDDSPNELIVQLARSLHTGGAPAYELEQRMEQAAQTLGVPAHFFSTPTSLFVTFEKETAFTRLIRVWPSETNLAKLAGLYDLYSNIEDGTLDVKQAWARLKEIESANYDYGTVTNIICYGVVGAGVGVFLGGNLTVVCVAGVISLIVGILVRSSEWLKLPGHLTNVLVGFVATILANFSHVFLPDGNVELTLLAGLVILLPGLQVTVSVNELATQNLASGTARMAGAMTTFLTMIFGVVMGYGMADWLFLPQEANDLEPLGIAWSIAALLPIALTFCVLFRARIRDVPWILLSTSIAFGTVKVGGIYLGPLAATWTAALAVGLFSNVFAKWRNRPAAIMLMPGLLLLVPGSLGFFGMSEIMIHDDMAGGVKIVSTMLLIAVSIVAGLLISNAILPIDRRQKR